MSNSSQQIWLSGEEEVHLISDLLDGNPHDERASGRTNKLALKYAYLVLKTPNNKVIIRDHHIEGHTLLQRKVVNLLQTLAIEAEFGRMPGYGAPSLTTAYTDPYNYAYWVKAMIP